MHTYTHIHTIHTYTQSTHTHNAHIHTMHTYTQYTHTHNTHIHTIHTYTQWTHTHNAHIYTIHTYTHMHMKELTDTAIELRNSVLLSETGSLGKEDMAELQDTSIRPLSEQFSESSEVSDSSAGKFKQFEDPFEPIKDTVSKSRRGQLLCFALKE